MNTNTDNLLGNFIRSIINEKGLSVRYLAKQIGLSHNYLNNLVKGYDPRTKKRIVPSIETLELIASGLAIPLEDLLRLSGYIKTQARPLDEAYEEQLKKQIRNLAEKLGITEIRAIEDIVEQGFSFADLRDSLTTLLKKKNV